jgi:DNA mismatch repair protein MutS
MEGFTPVMRQYIKIKEKYKDAILFFRMGDFYEMFFEDAVIASKILDIALTSRDKKKSEKIPMCGIPYHAANSYISKLIANGYKVAICEQLDNMDGAKLVSREVQRVVTPGLTLDIDSKENNFLMALHKEGNMFGLAFLDISTGEFMVAEFEDMDSLFEEVSKIEPREIVIKNNDPINEDIKRRVPDCSITLLDPYIFQYENSYTILKEHFKTSSLDGFGCRGIKAGIGAAGAIIYYVKETQKNDVNYISKLTPYRYKDFMIIDESTKRNLELLFNIDDGRREGSLISVLDKTLTPMGSRRLKKWVLYPLVDIKLINERLLAIEEIVRKVTVRKELRELLNGIYDIERLNGRIALNSSNARDLISLNISISKLPKLKDLLYDLESEFFIRIRENLDELSDIHELIDKSIKEEPPLTLKDGGIIKDGYNPELDQLRAYIRDGKRWILELERKERERTGIASLKIGYNKVFGYYIEITKPNLHLVPANYIRKQTIANGERYITPELKDWELKVLGGEEKVSELEYQLFSSIREDIAKNSDRIMNTSNLLGELDALLALAQSGAEYGYVKPIVDEGNVISIADGRHPVLERIERFVPNDIYLDGDEDRLLIITGPNMAGKSTVMRQVALIVIMAQMGSFVPASDARIGIVDRIFTRIGASDNLSRGLSTFMVEMNETANILNNATNRSLIILDEIGRGTSTYDGLSIAWAVAEYILDIGAKTLFATHYHELIKLSLVKSGVKNYNIAVREWNDEIIFLRKLIEGGVSKSYGIQVARLAGLPKKILERSKEILANLERGDLREGNMPRIAASKKKHMKRKINQLSLFSSPIDEIKRLDLSKITPGKALSIIKEIIKREED